MATSNIANLVAPPPGNSTTSFAQLVTPETAVDGDGSIPSVSSAGPIAWNGTPALYGYAEIPAVSGSSSAVWEVVNTNPPVNENFDFPVWTLYGSGVTPAAMTIAGTLAPNSDNGAFSASGGTTAQDATYPMPRFTSVPPVPATLSVSPNQASNTGNVSVIMNLNEYLPLFAYGSPQVILWASGLPDIPGTIQSTTYGMFPVAATFNLAGAQGASVTLCSYPGAGISPHFRRLHRRGGAALHIPSGSFERAVWGGKWQRTGNSYLVEPVMHLDRCERFAVVAGSVIGSVFPDPELLRASQSGSRPADRSYPGGRRHRTGFDSDPGGHGNVYLRNQPGQQGVPGQRRERQHFRHGAERVPVVGYQHSGVGEPVFGQSGFRQRNVQLHGHVEFGRSPNSHPDGGG